MREIAIRVPIVCAETVLDELLPLAPHGVFDVERGDEVELRVRGHADELPSREAVLATAGPWLRWSGEREVPDGWLEQRRLDFEPVVIADRLAIRPQWAPPSGRDLIDVVLDDRHAAFGSGLHPTTRGCVEALLELETRGSFADLGCGSGLLSIAAARLGFGPITALDYEPAAVEATRSNASANGVHVHVREADLFHEPPPAADVVAANVTAELHMRLAEVLAQSRPHTLIAAGMRAGDAEAVARGYGRGGLELRRSRGSGEWIVLELVSKTR
jgi:ribosomal protein L11 methyltransferase